MTSDRGSIITTTRELKSSHSSGGRQTVEIANAERAKTASYSSTLRWVAWMILRVAAKLLFRVRVYGKERVPTEGGALLIVNSLSRHDILNLTAASRRPILFASRSDPASIVGGLIGWCISLFRAGISRQEWEAEIRSGSIVCVFGEGELSRIGQMLCFSKETKRIIEDTHGPVIPVALDGAALGGVCREGPSHRPASAPSRRRKKVTVMIGAPIFSGATPAKVFERLQELITAAWEDRRSEMQPLHRAFVTTARKHPFRFAMADSRTPRLNFIGALARTIYLARRLAAEWEKEKYVGVLLPPSVAGALVNFAALLAGKIPVNLNYTTSGETITSCMDQCGTRIVISSQAFLEKVPLMLPGQMVLLEEVAANPRRGERITSLLMALLFPLRALEYALGRHNNAVMDDPATVIFSSGSTGEPKGIILSHFNITSNIQQLDRVFGLTKRDCFLGTLPFFHSFGFTGTLCLTGTLGVGVAYHPTPLDATAVGRLARDYSITFLLSTPTFIQLYLRSCAARDFGSVRVVMAGAEKLSQRLAEAFEDKFGIRPLEGYGCTECSPAVSVNTLDFRGSGICQIGGKRGTIGRPMPGMSVRIVDIETQKPAAVGKSGLLFVRGPNLMQGYLNNPGKTADVLRDGWYNTGDIATLDEDGFLRITDRLSRFSKIGGEMVPHIRVEERLHEIVEATELTFVVVGVPDIKRGERLIVLHSLKVERLDACLDGLAHDGMPNLWKPRRDDFVRVQSFPLLGTGKLDLRRIKELASELAQRE